MIPTSLEDTSTNKVPETLRSLLTLVKLLRFVIPATVSPEPPPVMFNEPVIVSPVFNTLSDEEPIMFAVIVPAEKLPDPSRCTA